MAFCTACGRSISDLAVACPKCGEPTGVGVAAPQPDANNKYLLPVGRTLLSIIAGYVGLFALVIFPLAPISLVLGIVALLQIRRRPGALGAGRAIFAVAVGSVWILAGAVLIVVGALSG